MTAFPQPHLHLGSRQDVLLGVAAGFTLWRQTPDAVLDADRPHPAGVVAPSGLAPSERLPAAFTDGCMAVAMVTVGSERGEVVAWRADACGAELLPSVRGRIAGQFRASVLPDGRASAGAFDGALR